MKQTHTFDAIIQAAGGGGAFITVPFDAEEAFGKKRVRVQATIDGEAYRGTLTRMGSPDHILIVLKEIRERIGKQPGDQVHVTLKEDTEPRVVDVPADLDAALAGNHSARSFFEQLSYTHRREYVQWIEEAKRAETRQRRIQRAVEMLEQGVKAR